MRVDAAGIVQCDRTASALHAVLTEAGCALQAAARGWFAAPGVMRVALVWRHRAAGISHRTVITVRVTGT